MPVYEYRCDTCDHQFELRQKISDPPADSCPKCGGAVHKMVSTVAFSLKGGGWYAEGYGAKAEAPKETESAATGATTEASPKECQADSTPKDTTAAPVAPASAPSQAEPKITAAENPATVEKSKSE
ncbi:MAG: zinc ribbon domain-containing protein [Desulfuromonadales bacterium]|nr:zinc ribbon domain-containing protein [Desulfuromonadales bacterium]